jgi:hypothetical protein
MTTIIEILNSIFIDPITTIISGLVQLLPQILIAAFLLVISYAISHFAGIIVRKILYQIKIDRLVRVRNLRDTFGATSLVAIYSQLVKWSLFIIFSGKIIGVVSLGFFSGIIDAIVFWLTKLVFTVFIIVTGLVLIDFFTLKILETKDAIIKYLITGVRAILIIVLVFTSLDQLGIKLAIAENIFLLVVGASLLGAALAVGIGFGLAMKDDAKKIIRQLRKKIK